MFMTAHVFYPVLGLVVVLDSLFPLIPSETVISLAGAWSGVQGSPNLFLILFTVTLAAIIGDNLCYFFGTRLIPGFVPVLGLRILDGYGCPISVRTGRLMC